LPTRQKKIFEYVAKNGKTQAVDLEPVLEGVNIRTIRRDLEELAESGFLNREVKGRQIFFWTKKTQVA
jgi:DeoR/GlpR family transcriptional regulator of sugar metabolism